MVIYSPGSDKAGGSSKKETNRGRKASLSGPDLYCTPPWVTRALFECAHINPVNIKQVWEPSAGLGHMAEVVSEYCGPVYSSDVCDYGYGDVIDFLTCEESPLLPKAVDLIITNPPFKHALEFALIANRLAPRVALLCRTQWLEGQERYNSLFSVNPPQKVIVFSERIVGMYAGKWDPNAKGAVTSYAWFIWDQTQTDATPRLAWFPPGCAQRFTKLDDVAKFARRRMPRPINEDEPLLPFLDTQSPVKSAGLGTETNKQKTEF